MLARLSLRLRVFLFFAFLGLGAVAIVLGALGVGYGRAQSGDMTSAFVFVAVLSVFGVLGLTAGVWLLFDENLAKPIERLAADMRVRAHTDGATAIDMQATRYLGDLAPAADAVGRQLSESATSTAATVASETARLALERDRLTALLTDIPVAIILISPAHRIVLYDGQAAAVLAQVHTPRLNASIFDYFDPTEVERAWASAVRFGREISFTMSGADGQQTYTARMKPLENGAGYMLMIDEAAAMISPETARPLIYDFDLLEQASGTSADDKLLSDLVFAVFDTETTGLLPHKDEVVQIGAVRIVRGRIVAGEKVDMLVDPQIPIPVVSTKVHGITQAMVQGAPTIDVAARRFHQFAQDAVIVAHNAPFDMAFLHRHSKRMGLSWDHPILDTVLVSAVLFGASQTHTLDALCDRLGVTIPAAQRHTAMGDARATAEVLCKMLPMLEARGIGTFGGILTEMRRHGRLLEDLN
ncbi:3'-5' exonuclease [Thalassovita taeanensis]|uniref:DNA-directed DNA polymerase n=1 Tax=Thalassovita taeanensis TaxID=657014 RepID=A0A1H9JCY2_9RHOB|nr:3'-5' exonuclease [Thalassovita taeanensis]SEQ84692.1 DNA polymerase-3 subunit epsilon [Thalassovita taeanensis]